MLNSPLTTESKKTFRFPNYLSVSLGRHIILPFKGGKNGCDLKFQ